MRGTVFVSQSQMHFNLFATFHSGKVSCTVPFFSAVNQCFDVQIFSEKLSYDKVRLLLKVQLTMKPKSTRVISLARSRINGLNNHMLARRSNLPRLRHAADVGTVGLDGEDVARSARSPRRDLFHVFRQVLGDAGGGHDGAVAEDGDVAFGPGLGQIAFELGERADEGNSRSGALGSNSFGYLSISSEGHGSDEAEESSFDLHRVVGW